MPPLSDSPEVRAYRLLQRVILICTGLIVLTIVLVFLFAADVSRDRCEELQGVRSYILGATERSLKATPTLDYYREHPRDLERALEVLEAQREAFATALDCSVF